MPKATGSAMTSSDLTLPDPARTSAATVLPAAVERARAIRARCEQEHDLDGATELLRGLRALTELLDKRRDRARLQAEQRRTELLIGQLLGQAENHGPATFHGVNGSASELHPSHRHEFRLMWAFRQVVERCLGEDRTDRASILRAIKAEQLTRGGPGSTEQARSHLWRLDRALRETEYLGLDPSQRKARAAKSDMLYKAERLASHPVERAERDAALLTWQGLAGVDLPPLTPARFRWLAAYCEHNGGATHGC